jgi:nicotinamide mononucleotide transporter
MHFFDIDHIFFTVLGYHMSYLEFFATLAGLFAIWLSARAIVWYWPIGIINIVLSFFLYFQVQLYPDMFLQIFFFVTNIVGWWRWTHPREFEEDRRNELRVSYMKREHLLLVALIGLGGTFLFGTLAENIHQILPGIFPKPSAFPYLDSFVTVMSIVTTFLVINKKIESWILWILIDVVAAGMYYVKGIWFFSFEYLIFCFIAAFGLWNWIREYRSYGLVIR